MEHCFCKKNCEPQRPCKQTASFENKALHGCMGSIDPNTHGYRCCHCMFQICLECKKMLALLMRMARLEENCRATHGSLSHCPKPRNLPSTQFRTSSWRIPGKMIWLITGDALQVCEVMTFMAIAVHVKLMQGTGPTFSGDHGCHT